MLSLLSTVRNGPGQKVRTDVGRGLPEGFAPERTQLGRTRPTERFQPLGKPMHRLQQPGSPSPSAGMWSPPICVIPW